MLLTYTAISRPFAQEARASKLIELKGKSLDKIPEGTLTNVLYPQDEDGGKKWREGGREGEGGREHLPCTKLDQFFPVQMLPLIKKSCDTLVEKLGECIDSDKSVEVFRLGLAGSN